MRPEVIHCRFVEYKHKHFELMILMLSRSLPVCPCFPSPIYAAIQKVFEDQEGCMDQKKNDEEWSEDIVWRGPGPSLEAKLCSHSLNGKSTSRT